MSHPVAIGYSMVERPDKKRAYHCDLCGHESDDIDAARAHKAVHVAGPDLLEAAKIGLACLESEEGSDKTEGDKVRAAIAKAEPKKENTDAEKQAP